MSIASTKKARKHIHIVCVKEMGRAGSREVMAGAVTTLLLQKKG